MSSKKQILNEIIQDINNNREKQVIGDRINTSLRNRANMYPGMWERYNNEKLLNEMNEDELRSMRGVGFAPDRFVFKNDPERAQYAQQINNLNPLIPENNPRVPIKQKSPPHPIFNEFKGFSDDPYFGDVETHIREQPLPPKKKGMTGIQKAGIGLGIGGALASLGGLIGWLVNRKKKKAAQVAQAAQTTPITQATPTTQATQKVFVKPKIGTTTTAPIASSPTIDRSKKPQTPDNLQPTPTLHTLQPNSTFQHSYLVKKPKKHTLRNI